MAAPLNPEALAKLKSFVEFVAANPAVLNLPELNFFKKLIEQFGGVVPEGTFQMPAGAKCPFGGDIKSESTNAANDEADEEIPGMEAESEESEVELDMEANNSQLILEPIHYIEDKPLIKIIEKQIPARTRISTKKGIRKKTILKTHKNRRIAKNKQLQHDVKVKMEYTLHEAGEQKKLNYTDPNDPLFTPQLEVKCEWSEENLERPAEDKDEAKIYFDSEDDKDKDYCVEQDDDKDYDEFKVVRKRKGYGKNDLGTKDADEADEIFDEDNDDEPLILLTEMKKTYKKKKIPRLSSCPETCKYKCTTKYDRQQRIDIFYYYWHLSKEDRVNFIREHIRKPLVKRLCRTKLRNNCCYFLKYYKIGETSDTKQPKETQMDSKLNNNAGGENEGLTKVCRKFFDGTLRLSDREIKEAIKNYELKPERIVRPLRETKNDEENKFTEKCSKQIQQPQQYLDPETGTLTDTKPKQKTKRRKRGEPLPERFPKPINCDIRCKYKCHQKFTEVERKQICDVFWSLDFKRRKDFILSRIETTDVKTPTMPEFRKTNRPIRAYQTKFYLRSGLKGENNRVCKHFMLNTLCINRFFIENALEFADKTTGAYTGADRRGGHKPHNKISDERKQTVLDHIESYPYWIPNKKSKTKYFHHSLSIKKMYESYKEKCEAEKIDYVSKHYYYKVFHAHFHILFLANPHAKKCLSFLKANPNISHYTGEEAGGCWLDFKGNKLDLRSINPAQTLDSRQNNLLFDDSRKSSVTPNPTDFVNMFRML